ncbi:MAG: type II toxin-antitoxin system Phd/YefM family antitoxin [Chloroflexota bacterium]
MERVGIRELRRGASGLVRRAARGDVIEVTDRGRAVAVLVPAMPSGFARLEREGLVRPAEGNLLDIDAFTLPVGAVAPSRVVEEGRAE